jgi:hypothetical protein
MAHSKKTARMPAMKFPKLQKRLRAARPAAIKGRFVYKSKRTK